MTDEADLIDRTGEATSARRRRIVDLVVVIDTQSIATAYPDPSQDNEEPTPVDPGHCYLIAPSVHVASGSATSSLSLYTHPGLKLRWRSVSMSGNSGQSAVLYSVETRHPDDETTVAAEALAVKRVVPVPILERGTQTNPPGFSGFSSDVYFLQINSGNEGNQVFDVRFYLTHDSEEDGKPVLSGYYRWQPTITLVST